MGRCQLFSAGVQGLTAGVNYLVSSDDTASVSGSGITYYAVNQTNYQSYFRNWNSNNFHLRNTSVNLFGLDGSLELAPAEDFDGVTRGR